MKQQKLGVIWPPDTKHSSKGAIGEQTLSRPKQTRDYALCSGDSGPWQDSRKSCAELPTCKSLKHGKLHCYGETKGKVRSIFPMPKACQQVQKRQKLRAAAGRKQKQLSVSCSWLASAFERPGNSKSRRKLTVLYGSLLPWRWLQASDGVSLSSTASARLSWLQRGQTASAKPERCSEQAEQAPLEACVETKTLSTSQIPPGGTYTRVLGRLRF